MKLLSLILEISGFVFTLIEVIFPKVADKIENLLDSISNNLGDFIRFRFETIKEEEITKTYTERCHIEETVGETEDGYRLVLVHPPERHIEYSTRPRHFFMATCVFTCSMALIAIALLFELPLMVVILSPLAICPFLIFLYLPELLGFINKCTNDRALGAIGLALAMTGLLFELYEYFHAR